MEAMVSTTWPTTWPPLTATSAVETTSWLAWRAFSAFCLTVLVSSSIELAVSSRLEACDSVRLDRSALPVAISRVATAMVSVECRISPTVVVRF